jgi:hypothetical protein
MGDDTHSTAGPDCDACGRSADFNFTDTVNATVLFCDDK